MIGPAGDAPLGRDAELARLRGFLERAASGPQAMLLTGPAGIGKTTLWRAAVRAARERGFRVLETRAVEAEAQLAFGGLADLLGRWLDGAGVELPLAQRDALDRALQRVPADGGAPAPLAVALGALAAVESLAAAGPLLLAVDDAPWLDRASLHVLEYVLRRLEEVPVALLVAVRTADETLPPPEMLQAFPGPMERLHVGPLDLHATGALLARALGLSLRRPALARLHADAGGNPFYALEIGRAIERGGGERAIEVLSLPAEMSTLVQRRLAALPEPARLPLAAVAALSQPTRQLLLAAIPWAGEGLDAAVAAGVVEVDGERLRFTHPLLAAAAYARLSDAERRLLHATLAEAAPDAEQRGRHLRLATAQPSADVAGQLDAAAASARSRGALDAAAELALEAARVTPPEELDEIGLRRVTAAEYFVRAGDAPRARAVLEEWIARAPRGTGRARALRALADVRSADSWPAKRELLEQALAEAGGDHGLRAVILESLSQLRWHMLADGAASLQNAREAVAEAEQQEDPAALSSALLSCLFAELNAGSGFDASLLRRAEELAPRVEHVRVFLWPAYARASVEVDRDHAAEGYRILERLHGRAEELGDYDSLPIIAETLGWAANRLGRWQEGLAWVLEAERGARLSGQASAVALSLVTKAYLLIALGREEEGEAAAEEALGVAAATGARLYACQALGALGRLALARGELQRAAQLLEEPTTAFVAAGFRQPFRSGWVSDRAEALIGLGRVDEALALLDGDAGRPRPLLAGEAALLLRVRGLAATVGGDGPAALASFDAALDEQAAGGDPFEHARTLLAKGEALRRLRQRGAARDALSAALAIFTELGTPRWRERAAAELARTGHRAAGAPLSPTEQQVADLVAAGRTNREVAELLFMSPHTVEAHLTRIYLSLGVRGRTEMVRVLATRGTTTAEEAVAPE